MKVFVVGDYKSGTGPANVTKEYINRLSCKVMRLTASSKFMRLIQLFCNMPFCDVVFISGHSNQNLWAIKFAKRFDKPVAFLMHGCVEYENEINGVPDASMTECERTTLREADKIFAVSDSFKEWLCNRYPQYKDKISSLINGVSKPDEKLLCNKDLREKRLIFTIGGGMPRKKIVSICKAVKRLKEDDIDVKLVVAGAEGKDTDVINSFDFVENIGIVPTRTIKDYFKKAGVFIQNSCFETFGLAPIEALENGCSVLLSREVGALDIIGDTCDDDIIFDYNDHIEIAQKIKHMLEYPNGKRLFDSIDYDSCNWDVRSEELCNKLAELIQKKAE